MAITGAVPFAARAHVAMLIGGFRSPSAIMYCAYGTDDTAPNNNNDSLGAEVDRATAVVTATVGANFEATATLTIPYDLTIGEVGLFNAYNELMYREGGMSVAKEEDDTYTITFNGTVISWDDSGFSTGGKVETRDLIINNSSPEAFTHIAYGTGTTAENATHTTLATETERVAASVETLSILSPFDTIRFAGLFSAVSSATTISEIGVFNDATAGDMLRRELLDNTVSIPAGQKPVVVLDVIIRGSTSTA